MTKSLNKKILVIGDLMLDEYLEYAFKKRSAESNCNIYDHISTYNQLGGAGNLALSLSRIFEKVDFVSITGKDNYQLTINNLIKSSKINPIIFIDKKRITNTKTRVYVNKIQKLRLDSDPKMISDEVHKKCMNFLLKNISKYDLIFIADYCKGVVNHKLIKLLKENKKNIYMCIDTKNINIKNYEYFDLIKKNMTEYNKLNRLYKSDKFKYLLTKSSKGLSYRSDKNISVSGLNVRVRDVSGAGDASLATFVYCQKNLNLDILRSLRITNLICSYLVTKRGNCIVDKKMIHHVNFYLDCGFNETKILRYLNSNIKILFANGCFDLLHPGHKFLLKTISKANNFVVVGLNSDKSVKLNKGQDRPIESQSIRMKKLLKLGIINSVIIFEEKTPINLIKTIIPDIIVKGEEYENLLVVGSSYIKQFGGEIRFIKKYRNYSTTNILNKK